MKLQSRLFITLFILSLLLTGHSTAQIDDFLVESRVADPIVGSISGERAKDYVERISRFHRIRGGGPGSGFNDAVDYVVSVLEPFGLDDVHVERFLSDGYTTYLRWRSPIGWRVKKAKLYLIEPEKQSLADFSHTAVSLMAYSNGGEGEAPVVFVGDGVDDADYEDVDVKGKIVFATGGDGNGIHRKAVLERGAIGIVVGPSRRPDRYDYPDLVELKRLNFSGEEREKAGWGFSLTRRQTEHMLRLFGRGIDVRMYAVVDAELFDGEMPVVSALIRGRDPEAKEVLIMGHLDHYKPGANDNASGSAGMIEMAGILTELINDGEIERPLRSIRFLWLPELHGAMAYVDAHPEVGDRTLVGINLDMIGEDYESCRSHLIMTRPPYSNPSYLGDVVESMIRWVDGLNLFSERGSRNKLNYRDVGYSGGSDHVIFTDPTVGVPSLMLVHSDVFHHTSYDTPDRCDPTEMRRVITTATMAAYTIANANDRTARRIAFLTSQRGLGRMHEKTVASLKSIDHALYEASDGNQAAYTFQKGMKNISVLADVEKNAVLSTIELTQSKETAEIITRLADELDKEAMQEKDRLRYTYQSMCNEVNIHPEKYTLSRKEREADRFVPKRRYRGPLPSDYLFTGLGEDYEWYTQNRDKVGGNFGSKTFEISNLIDGERSILQICDIINAEFGETSIDFVVHYVKDLEKIGLVSF